MLPSRDKDLTEQLDDAELLQLAKEHLRDVSSANTISFKEVAAQNGIDLDTLPIEDIELE